MKEKIKKIEKKPMIYLIALFMAAGAIGLYIVSGGSHDSAVEEIVEDLIEEHTGIEIDITGDSDETYDCECASLFESDKL